MLCCKAALPPPNRNDDAPSFSHYVRQPSRAMNMQKKAQVFNLGESSTEVFT